MTLMNLSHVPDLPALAMLKSVIREGSFSAAAKEWGVSQQAMSQRMRSIESLVGAALFTRSPQGIAVTEAGVALLPAIDRLLEQADVLAQAIAALSVTRGESVDIAASQTIAEHLVPGWLMRFKAQQRAALASPQDTAPTIHAHVANSRDVVALVRERAVDIGFIETPTIPGDLSHASFLEDDLVLVVSPRHKLARRTAPLILDDIAGMPLVLREPGSGTRDTLERALESAGLGAPVAALELGTSAAIRSAVAAGIAPTVMSIHSVRDDVSLGKLVAIEFEGQVLRRPLTALWNGPVHRLSLPARELLGVIFDRA